ncbi:MAG: hypothetical protein ACI9U2_001672 [Bradymonadia bacterium]|jgi:hypothetical protein
MRIVCLIALLGTLAASPVGAQSVDLPLTLWTQVQDALTPPVAAGPARAFSVIDQRLDGRIAQDVLTARLDMRFEAFVVDGWLEVPVLDGAASLSTVTLNGEPAVLRRVDQTYVVGVSKPGVYRLRARVLRSADDLRSMTLALSDGPTHLSILVPETGVRARLEGGVITAQFVEGTATRLTGETNGDIELRWARAEADDVAPDFALDLASVFTVDSTVIKAQTVVQVTLKSGAIDRVALPVPAGVEVVEVTGDAVLQWRTIDRDGSRLLTVLLTHLIDADAELNVTTQQAIAGDTQAVVELRGVGGPPALVALGRVRGALGVQARTGLEVALQAQEGIERIDAAALPDAVTELTEQPLLFGARFAAPPALSLTLTRNATVSLTATIIDDLEATTLLLEDGGEISKLRLHMRNNARQHLAIRLPPGAELSHALIEGVPVTPAKDGARLLIPLRQSTQTAGGRYHVVQPGENLGEIAYIYYSNPRHWQRILNANDDLYDPSDVQPGMRLRVPAPEGVEVEESRFVIELAWRIDRPAMGLWGQRALTLAELDVDVVRANWHVYLPRALRPLQFTTPFEQRSARRYEPLSRLRRFIRRAIISDANAGYAGVLDTRRAAFEAEARGLAAQGRALGIAPVVGTRYRFRQLMLGSAVPQIQVVWLNESAVTALHWGGLFWAALVVLGVLRPRSRLLSGVVGLVALVPLLWAGYHVVGVYRHLIWGINLGLALLFLRHRAGAWRAAIASLVTANASLTWLRPGNLAFAVGLWALLAGIVAFPMLLPLGLMAGLTLAWIHARQTFTAALG